MPSKLPKLSKLKLPATSPGDRKLLLVTVLVVAGFLVLNYQGKLERTEKLATYPNQACVGLGTALKNGLDLKHYDLKATSLTGHPMEGAVGQHKCIAGRVITERHYNPDGSGAESGYELSSDVVYFESPQAAYAHADTIQNKSRSWSVDEAGSRSGIKQDRSLFTYLVTDVKEPYFESYTVRDNALVLLSLPCPMSIKDDPNEAFTECQSVAEKVLREYADKVQSNLRSDPLFD